MWSRRREAIIGARIRQARAVAGLFQDAVAAELTARGYASSQSAVSRLERGMEPRHLYMPGPFLEAVAATLHVSIGSLLAGAEAVPEEHGAV